MHARPRPAHHTTPRQRKCTEASPLPGATHGPQVQLLRCDNEEYDSLIKADSGTWSREETDYLFDLCEQYDLRWPVISDRYQVSGGGGGVRARACVCVRGEQRGRGTAHAQVSYLAGWLAAACVREGTLALWGPCSGGSGWSPAGDTLEACE